MFGCGILDRIWHHGDVPPAFHQQKILPVHQLFSVGERKQPRSKWSETTLGFDFANEMWHKKTKEGATRTAAWLGLVPADSARDAEEGRRGRTLSENSVCTSRTAGSSFSYTTGWDWNENKSARGIYKWTTATVRIHGDWLWLAEGRRGLTLCLTSALWRKLGSGIVSTRDPTGQTGEDVNGAQRRSCCNILDQSSFNYMTIFYWFINNSLRCNETKTNHSIFTFYRWRKNTTNEC